MTQTDDRRALPPLGPDRIPLLELCGVTKRFAGIPAITDVSVSLHRGEILGLIGENGAGKSTLMKVCAGVHEGGTFDGVLSVDGAPQVFTGVQDAESVGVVMIAQELQVAPELSIAENMFVGNLPRRGVIVDRVKLNDQAGKWLSFFGITTSPSMPAKVLGPSEQRLMLIAGALSKHARVLVLDEPTAALTDVEAETLFAHLMRLATDGVGIIFITHRLDEIDRVADRIIVLRNGAVAKEFRAGTPSRSDLVHAMLGRDLASAPSAARAPRETPVALSVKGVCVADPTNPAKLRVSSAYLSLRQGEIVGLYGLVGAGRTELLNAIYGSWSGDVDGRVEVNQRDYAERSPKASLDRGMALLTEDRKATGILQGQTIQANLSAASLQRVSRRGMLDRLAETSANRQMLERLNVQPPQLTAVIEGLSGGNQQKVLLGRALAAKPTILLLDEPTLGVDVGSRFRMYEYIRELASEGMSILLASSDLEEVRSECDRIVVMYKGRVYGEFEAGCERRDLLAAATGGTDG